MLNDRLNFRITNAQDQIETQECGIKLRGNTIDYARPPHTRSCCCPCLLPCINVVQQCKFLYFQILATYFWLDLDVLTEFFHTCKYPSPEYSKYFRSTKNLYVCERLLEQIQHILCTPVTMSSTNQTNS